MGSYRSLETATGTPIQQGGASLTGGSYQNVQAGSGVFGYLREQDGEKVLVLLNFGTEDAPLRLPELEGATLLLSSHDDADSSLLRGNEAQLWRLN
jgi:glycosidase